MSNEDEEAQVVREWLLEVIKRTGLKPTPFARGADLAPSTVLRALDPENPSSLERRSIKKIVDRYHVPWPSIHQHHAQSGSSGFSEDELLPYDSGPIFAGEPLEPDQYVLEVNTRALDLVGYVPRDKVLFDMKAHAEPEDVVQAQVYSLAAIAAETVLRLYDPPYLVARTADRNAQHKPLLVDGQRVRIVAVARRMLRSRD